jgi:anti-anti-sigma factor
MRAAMYTHAENERIVLGIKAERPAEAPSVLRVAISANLVGTNAPQLRTITDDAIDEGRITITLDLEHCGYVDARGFGILVGIANRVNRRGGSVTITNAHEDLRTVFVGHGIAELFRFAPSEVTP